MFILLGQEIITGLKFKYKILVWFSASPDNDSNSHFPCICNGQLSVDNEMISCAAKECYGKKFHRSCLKLEGKRVTVKWRCDMCVKKSKKRNPLATINQRLITS